MAGQFGAIWAGAVATCLSHAFGRRARLSPPPGAVSAEGLGRTPRLGVLAGQAEVTGQVEEAGMCRGGARACVGARSRGAGNAGRQGVGRWMGVHLGGGRVASPGTVGGERTRQDVLGGRSGARGGGAGPGHGLFSRAGDEVTWLHSGLPGHKGRMAAQPGRADSECTQPIGSLVKAGDLKAQRMRPGRTGLGWLASKGPRAWVLLGRAGSGPAPALLCQPVWVPAAARLELSAEEWGQQCPHGEGPAVAVSPASSPLDGGGWWFLFSPFRLWCF